MIYLRTYINSNYGNHGHQLKDLIGAYTIAKLFNFKYLYQPYPYLDFAGFDVGEKSIDILKNKKYKKIIINGKPNRKNFDQIKDVIDNHLNGVNRKKDVVIVCAGRTGIFPYRIRQTHSKLFNTILREITKKYRIKNRNRNTYFKKNVINVAIHVSGGVRRGNTRSIRYNFPLSYYENIIKDIKKGLNGKDHEIYVYAERTYGKFVRPLKQYENVTLKIGSNRGQKNNELIHEIFHHFVKADILVGCNSGFSAVASYFRNKKFTIYHEHGHLANMPETHHLKTTDDGHFNYIKLRKL